MIRGLVAVVLMGLVGCSGPSRGEVWRVAIEELPGSVQHEWATRFEERIEAETDVDVVVYPYGALGTSDHTTELLHNGSLQVAMASPGHLGKLIPEVQAFLLHFALTEDEAANNRALSDPELVGLLDELYAPKGFQLLSIYSEGWMVWTLDRPVRAPEDFAGLKMRVMTSPLLLSAYEAYGASPTPMPYAEVYSGLQLSMIDGQVNPIFAIEEMSFYEVTDVMVFPNHAPFVTTAAANREFYQGLSEERRTLVDRVVADLQEEILGVQVEFNDERLERILDKRPEIEVIELSDAERARFRARAEPVREAYLESAPRGVEVLDALDEAVRRARR